MLVVKNLSLSWKVRAFPFVMLGLVTLVPGHRSLFAEGAPEGAVISDGAVVPEGAAVPDENGVINESHIIKKMEMEIGEKLNPLQNGDESGEKKAVAPSAKEEKDSAKNSYMVRLNLNGTAPVEGEVHLNQKILVLYEEKNHSGKSYTIPLAEIKKLEFLGWNESAANKGGDGSTKVYFLPEKCKVETRDGKSYTGFFASMDWMQLVLSGPASRENYRTYFMQKEKKDLPSSSSATGAKNPVVAASTEAKGGSEKGNAASSSRDLPASLVVGVEFYENEMDQPKRNTAFRKLSE